MAANHSPKVRIQSRRGHIIPRVRYGPLALDGIGAVVLIAIILAVYLIKVILKVLAIIGLAIFVAVKNHTLPRAANAARHSHHRCTGIYRALRAFYVP